MKTLDMLLKIPFIAKFTGEPFTHTRKNLSLSPQIVAFMILPCSITPQQSYVCFHVCPVIPIHGHKRPLQLTQAKDYLVDTTAAT